MVDPSERDSQSDLDRAMDKGGAVVIVNPIRRRSRKKWALLEPGWRCLRALTPDGDAFARGERGCFELLDKLADRTLYVRGSLTSMLHTTGALAWTAEVWRSRAVRMKLDGSKAEVISLRGSLPTDSTAFDALDDFLGFLSDFGIGPGAISTMGWNLWRATLREPVTISADPSVVGPAVFGGRQEIREPRAYSHMISADISSAYPHSMAAAPFALTLRPVSVTTALDPETAGIARARVLVPNEVPFAPLPVRVAPEIIQWQRGPIEGTWTWGELAAAADFGCRVEVVDSWAPSREADLFGEWWGLVQAARALSGGAAKLAKVVSNSTWGAFAMRGDEASTVRWADDVGDRSVTVSRSISNLPHHRTAHIAAESSSRVRVRLLREGLYGGRFSPVHVDTDGIIIRRSAGLPEPAGDAPGEWRQKAKMTKVEIRAPQVYRSRCGVAGCFDWHYTTAGVPPEKARQVFERVGRLGIAIGFTGRDVVLPPMNPGPGAVAHLISVARNLVGGVYGPGLGD